MNVDTIHHEALRVDIHTICKYIQFMEFEWDENKRLPNISKHGIDFRDAAKLFKNPYLIMKDGRRDHGEKRYIAFGQVEARLMVLAFTERE